MESRPPVIRYEEMSSFWKRHSKLKKVLAVAIPVLIIGVVVIGILISQQEREEEKPDVKGYIHAGGNVLDHYYFAYIKKNESQSYADLEVLFYPGECKWIDGTYKTAEEFDNLIDTNDYIEIKVYEQSYLTYRAIKVLKFEDRSP